MPGRSYAFGDKPVISVKDIYWLAGILEGEGCFRCNEYGLSPCIGIFMNDEDIISKVAYFFRRPYYSDYPGYRVRIGSNDAIGWMLTLYPLLGIRRQAKISSIVKMWSAYSIKLQRIRNHSGIGNKCRQGHLIKDENVAVRGDYIRCRICCTSSTKTRNIRLRQRLISKYGGESDAC